MVMNVMMRLLQIKGYKTYTSIKKRLIETIEDHLIIYTLGLKSLSFPDLLKCPLGLILSLFSLLSF